MAKRSKPWVKDVQAFLLFTLLDGVLACMGVRIGPGSAGDVWLWLFACPYAMARDFSRALSAVLCSSLGRSSPA